MKRRNEIEEDKPQVMNWNAGQEYLSLIIDIKYQYNAALVSDEWAIAIDLLSAELDLSWAIIKHKCDNLGREEGKEVLVVYNLIMKRVNQYFGLLKNGSDSFSKQLMLRQKIGVIRRSVWELQGKHGILYPLQEKEEDRSKKSTALTN